MAATKVSVTLDEELVEQARERSSSRGFSAYVNEALASRLQHDRLREFLSEMENERGPIPDDVREEVRKEWSGPRRARRARRSA